jgi:hypothetical protein
VSKDSDRSLARIEIADLLRLAGLAAALASVAHQSVFTLAGVPRMTVALWRLAGQEQWGHGQITYPQAWDHQYQDPDGSSWLFAQLDGRAGSYLDYASEYFERQLPAEAVTAILEHRPLTDGLIHALNPARSFQDLADDLCKIGYPAD